MASTAQADRTAPVTTRLRVEGMTCAACQSHVEHALREVPGVSEASVNLMTHSAEVKWTAGATPGPAELDALVASVSDAGYDAFPREDNAPAVPADHRAEERGLRDRAVFTLAAGIAVMIAQMAVTPHLTGTGLFVLHLVLLAVTLAGMVFGGAAIYAAAWRAAVHRGTNMNTLVALGTGAAFLSSLVATFAPGFFLRHGMSADVYYDAVLLILGFLLVGRWLDARAKRQTLNALNELMKLQPETARVLRNGVEVDIPAAEVMSGNIVVVRPGERIPVDGTVIEGRSSVDESIITGESRAVPRGVGDTVIGGSLNYDGALQFRATAVGEQSVLAQMLRLMEQAQSSKAPMQQIADRASGIFVPSVLGLALVCFLAWTFLGHDAGRALAIAISVLVIACPCAMGLAVPAAQTVAVGRGAKMGLLFKGGESVERMARIDTLLLDKTGTITEGKPSVIAMTPAPGVTEQQLLSTAAAVEQGSEHPLAHGIAAAAKERGLALAKVTDFQALPGTGVQARLDGTLISVRAARETNDSSTEGTLVEVWQGEPGQETRLGSLELRDTLRPGAVEAIRKLHALGLRVAMVTGDAEAPAKSIARAAGIEEVVAQCRPEHKLDVVRQRQAAGQNVGMVGDGINDAAALAQANAGIAMGTCTDLAREAGDIILLGGQPAQIPDAILLSRATLRIMRQNLGWAFLYNVLGIPLAAGVLYPAFHILLNPAVAAAAMALSSVSVLGNSLRLQRFQARYTQS
uniref:P-type Cu(+) transporter n=1 Tax=Acidobacterium capsulatum TaxID=33075 RepID=A0A7V5CV35_9BACT